MKFAPCCNNDDPLTAWPSEFPELLLPGTRDQPGCPVFRSYGIKYATREGGRLICGFANPGEEKPPYDDQPLYSVRIDHPGEPCASTEGVSGVIGAEGVIPCQMSDATTRIVYSLGFCGSESSYSGCECWEAWKTPPLSPPSFSEPVDIAALADAAPWTVDNFGAPKSEWTDELISWDRVIATSNSLSQGSARSCMPTGYGGQTTWRKHALAVRESRLTIPPFGFSLAEDVVVETEWTVYHGSWTDTAPVVPQTITLTTIIPAGHYSLADSDDGQCGYKTFYSEPVELAPDYGYYITTNWRGAYCDPGAIIPES